MEINATLLLQLAMFLLLMVLLSQFLFQPLLALFEARERRIDGAQDEAKQYREDADAKAAIIADRMLQARQEARASLGGYKDKAKERELAILEAARQASQAKLEEARGVLAQQVQVAQTQLHEDAKTLAKEMASKALGRAL